MATHIQKILKRIFPNARKKFEKTCASTESKLFAAHQKLRDLCLETGNIRSILKVGEWNEQAPGVFSQICCLSDREQTSLDVIFEENARLPKQVHVDNKKIVFVISGYLIEEISGAFIPSGEVYFVKPGATHEFHAPHGAKLKIIYEPALKPF